MNKRITSLFCLFLLAPCLSHAIIRKLTEKIQIPLLLSQRVLVRNMSTLSTEEHRQIKKDVMWLQYKIIHIQASLDNGCTPWLSFACNEPDHIRKELGLLKSEYAKLKLRLHQNEQ